jgi:dephospho-CoA kinase
MRVPAQIDYLRKFDFILISIDADPKIRFGRAKSRGKHLEADTYQEFVELEEKENSGDFTQRVFEVMDMADYHIKNDGSLQELYKKLDDIISHLK